MVNKNEKRVIITFTWRHPPPLKHFPCFYCPNYKNEDDIEHMRLRLTSNIDVYTIYECVYDKYNKEIPELKLATPKQIEQYLKYKKLLPKFGELQ